jgi:hypothetical protein
MITGLDPRFMGMEEDQPVVTVVFRMRKRTRRWKILSWLGMQKTTTAYPCQSRPWRKVFFAAAGSIESGLGTTTHSATMIMLARWPPALKEFPRQLPLDVFLVYIVKRPPAQTRELHVSYKYNLVQTDTIALTARAAKNSILDLTDN